LNIDTNGLWYITARNCAAYGSKDQLAAILLADKAEAEASDKICSDYAFISSQLHLVAESGSRAFIGVPKNLVLTAAVIAVSDEPCCHVW